MTIATDQSGNSAVRMDTPTLGASTELKNVFAEVSFNFGDTTPPSVGALRFFVGTEDPTSDTTNAYSDEKAPVGSLYIRIGTFNATSGAPEAATLFFKKTKAVANTSSGFTAITQA